MSESSFVDKSYHSHSVSFENYTEGIYIYKRLKLISELFIKI